MSEQSQPILASLRLTVNPGVPRSTTSRLTPRAPGPPVRTAVVTKSARVPLVMNVLAPSTTNSSPSRTARVRSAPTSEPASGSVTPSDPMSSPARVGRTNRSIRSLSPEATMCGRAIAWVNSAASSPEEAPASTIASIDVTTSIRSPPCPPTSSGKPMPSSPAAAASRCRERGISPASSHAASRGTTCRRTNPAADPRSASRSGVVHGSPTNPPVTGSASGISSVRLSSHSPTALPCGSNLVLAATPRPSSPSITTLTARRFGSGCTVTGRSAASGSSSRTLPGVSVAASHAAASSLRAHTPTFAVPPLSPLRARATAPSGARRVGPPTVRLCLPL